MQLRKLAVVVATCLPLAATAQVYKWVDAKGVTHYGQKPPATADSRELQLRDPTGGPSPKAAAASPSVQEMENGFRQRQLERQQAEAKEAAERAQRTQRCQSLRNNANGLKNARRVYVRNDQGERVIMEDAQRDAEIAKLEAAYSRECP